MYQFCTIDHQNKRFETVDLQTDDFFNRNAWKFDNVVKVPFIVLSPLFRGMLI